MISIWIIYFLVIANFMFGNGKSRNRCDIMHYKHCCNPLIYNSCFEKCHQWAILNCFQDRGEHDQIVTDSFDAKSSLLSTVRFKNNRNELRGKMKKTFINEQCGTASAEFAPCVQKEVADQIFFDCCKLFVKPECHELCQYETSRYFAQLLLLESLHKKQCSMDNIFSVLYCASQNRDNRLCCRQFGLTSPKLGVGQRCLRMCDPYRFGIFILNKIDFICLSNWNIIMYCHHGGLK